MILSGIFIFFSLALLFVKLPSRWQLRLLGHPLLLDLAVAMFTLVVHWGTFTGIMSATIAGLLTSAATGLARRACGFTQGSRYIPGWLHLKR
jgi:hypothetical protein